MMSSDVELNPGPRQPKYPCQICHKVVTWKTRGVACDDCSKWYHTDFMHMPTQIYESLKNLSWHCINCGLPNFSTNLFESINLESTNSFPILDKTNDSETPASPGPPKHCSSPVKPKHPNINKYNNIKVLNINFQSIKNKKEELWNLVDTSDPDIIFGTETWLNNNITSSEIFPSDMNYYVVRKEGEDGYGGVLIAITKNFIFEAITVKQKVQCQFLKIQLSNSKSLLIGCIYRPPSSNIDYARELQEAIRSVMKNNRSSVLWLSGDLNLPDIDWEANNITVSQNSKEINETYMEIIAENFLK